MTIEIGTEACVAAYERAAQSNKKAADALRPAMRAILECGLAALSPPEPTADRIEHAVMSLTKGKPFPSVSLSRAGGIDEWRGIMRDALAAAYAMPLQDHGWQDISTAPTDGTWVLGWEPHINGKYTPHEVMRWRRHGGTYGAGWRNSMDNLVGATHWRPLPAAPMVAEERADG